MDGQSWVVTVTTTPAGTSAASVCGEFDLVAAADVHETLKPLLTRDMLIDLSAVTFLDSSGLRCLLALQAQAVRQGRRLTVTDASPAVRRIFDLIATGPVLLATIDNRGPERL